MSDVEVDVESTVSGPVPSDEVDVRIDVAEAAPDAILLVGTDGIIRYANRMAGQLFGTPTASLVGSGVDQLLPDSLRAEHAALRAGYASTPAIRPMGAAGDLLAQRADGTLVPVAVSLSPTTHLGEPAVIAVVRDRSVHRAAAAHTRRIERLVDRAHEGVYLVDPDSLRFVYVNAGAADQSGYGRQALLSMTPAELLPDISESVLRRVVARASVEGQLTPLVTRLRRANGDEISVEVLIEWDTGEDGASMIAALVRDLSERRDSEDAFYEMRERFALVAERERIARDLHDRVIQRLFALGMSLQARLDHKSATELSTRLGETVESLDDTVREIRSVIFELKPPVPVESVRRRIMQVARDGRRWLGFEPRVDVASDIDTLLDEDLADAIIDVIDEGLANVARHADATDVVVSVSITPEDRVRVEIADDGSGVDATWRSRSGLETLTAMAAELGGALSLGPNAGRQGARLQWSVPLGAR